MTDLSDVDIVSIIRAERRLEREAVIKELERLEGLHLSLDEAIHKLKEVE